MYLRSALCENISTLELLAGQALLGAFKWLIFRHIWGAWRGGGIGADGEPKSQILTPQNFLLKTFLLLSISDSRVSEFSKYKDSNLPSGLMTAVILLVPIDGEDT